MSELNIFISYKHEFKDSALKVRKAIKFVDVDQKVETFMDDGIPGGEVWVNWIREHIGMSNILLFLFSEPTANWDWCLFEAGMFLGAEERTKRVICIHHPSFNPPAQLQHLQSEPAEDDNIKKLLTDIYTTTNITNLPEPLYPDLIHLRGKIDHASKVICSEFIPRIVGKRDYDKFIDLEVTRIDNLKGPNIPADSAVQSSSDSMKIFGLATDKLSWTQFVDDATELGDTRWLNELNDVIVKAAKNRLFSPIHATVVGWDGTIYLPVLSSVDFYSNKSARFHVHFIEDVSSRIMDMPASLGVLQTCLRLGTRFRYEGLMKCKSFLEDANVEDVVKNYSKTVATSIATVEKEAKSRGNLSLESILLAFSESSEQKKVKEMLLKWQQMKDNLLEELAAGNITGSITAINAVLEVNSEFLKLIVERYRVILLGLVAAGN